MKPSLAHCPPRLPAARTLPAVAALLALASLATATARGSPLIDPFLERFRVGWYQDPAKIVLADGWPADLFAPAQVDSIWRQAAEASLDAVASRPDTLLLWRFLTPGSTAMAEAEVAAWRARHRARWIEFAAEAVPPDESATTAGWLAKEMLYKKALKYYDTNNYDICRNVVVRLLQLRTQLAMADDEVFVWSLRKRRLDAMLEPQTHRESGVWPEMLALPPGDAASAWAIWGAHRRASGSALIPGGSATPDLGRWLARVRRTWLSAEDLAGFPDAVAAGLGSVALAPGPELQRHFARWKSPPGEVRWQELWLRGKLRSVGWEPHVAESWAARHDLFPANRVRLLRRASEERLLKGQWSSGLKDLRTALTIAGAGEAGTGMRRDLADWAAQAIALAAARGRPGDAAAVAASLRARLPAAEWRAWVAALSTAHRAAAGLGPAAPPDSSRVARAGLTVRNGEAAPVFAAPAGGAAALVARDEAMVWDAWARWGLALAAHDPRLASQGTREGDYAADLAAVLRARDGGERREVACAAIASYLRAFPSRDVVLDWLLERDIARIAAGAGPAPDLLPGAVRGGGWPARHALLGACLAAGDLGGQLLLARDLPTRGLAESDRLRLLYPVPPPGPLLAALSRSAIEEPLLLAVARNESRFDLGARSGAGALGLLQIMPFHFRDRGLESGRARWRSPEVAVQMGSGLLAEAARACRGDPYRTLAAYNAGAEAVARWNRQLGTRGAPGLFLSWIGYAETRGYVEKVLIDREIYSWILTGGQSDTP